MNEQNKIEYDRDALHSVLQKDAPLLMGSNYDYENFSLTIEDVYISEGLLLEYEIKGIEVTFKNCEFLEDIYFEGDKNKYFTFDNCRFYKSLHFQNGKFNHIQVIDSKFQERLEFRNSDFQVIEIGNVRDANIELTAITAKSISISSERKVDILESITIAGSDIKFLSIADLSIMRLALNGHIKNDAVILFQNLFCSQVSFSGVSNDGALKLSGLSYWHLPINNSLYDFLISHCNLNKAELYNINFRSFPRVIFTESLITDCVFANIHWPDKIGQNHSGSIKALRHSNRHKRETYRQLKFVMSKQGNTYDEQYFHVLELNALYKSLEWKSHPWTKIVLGLSWLSSNYGQSIIRPILFLIGLNAILFAWLYGLETHWSEPITMAVDSGSRMNVVGVFINSLNPLHKFDDSHKGMEVAVDTLMRIVSSYSIYNFIRASRRFIK